MSNSRGSTKAILRACSMSLHIEEHGRKTELANGARLCQLAETIVPLAAQPHKPVTGPFHLEQTRCPLIVLTARLVAHPRSIGESTVHVLVPMVVATFGRPFGAVSEIMFS